MNKADELALAAINTVALDELTRVFERFRGDPSGDYWAPLTHWMLAVQQIDNRVKNKDQTCWASLLAYLADYDVPAWPEQIVQFLTGKAIAFWLDKGDDK